MAIGALIPFTVMFSAVNREIHAVVVKVCRYPDCFTMTVLASRWESGRGVIRIIRLVIVWQVATDAGIGRVVVVAVVAGVAVVGDGRVGAIQRVIVIVDREFRRLPAVGRMA